MPKWPLNLLRLFSKYHPNANPICSTDCFRRGKCHTFLVSKPKNQMYIPKDNWWRFSPIDSSLGELTIQDSQSIQLTPIYSIDFEENIQLNKLAKCYGHWKIKSWVFSLYVFGGIGEICSYVCVYVYIWTCTGTCVHVCSMHVQVRRQPWLLLFCRWCLPIFMRWGLSLGPGTHWQI